MSREELAKYCKYGIDFFFIDRVLNIDNKTISAEYTFQKDSIISKNHLLDFALMPGSIIVEGASQTFAMFLRNLFKENEKHIVIYNYEDVKFFKPVFPGDTILYETKFLGEDLSKLKFETNITKSGLQIASVVGNCKIVAKEKMIK